MKRYESASLLAVAAVAGGAIVAASALARDAPGNQALPATQLSANLGVTPSRAGTKQSPQDARIDAVFKIATERGLDAPIVTGVDLLVGQGISWNGGDYVSCSTRVLDRRGPGGCPRESLVGSAVARSKAGTAGTESDIAFVNGGETRLFAYTSFEYPARVRETVVVQTSDMSGRWSYKGSLRVPRSLQVVAGVPIHTTAIKLGLGDRPYAKGYVTTTSCPRGGWRYRATAHYRYDLSGQTGQDTASGTIPCTS